MKAGTESYVRQLSNAPENAQNDQKLRENEPILSTCPPAAPPGQIGRPERDENWVS